MRCSALITSGCLSGLLLAMGLCNASLAQGDALRRLHIDRHIFQVEVATTPAQRGHGLMHRTRLARNGGMLFVFKRADRYCFWMHDTPLPLSIAFIDNTGRIDSLDDMQPDTDASHCPSTDIRYALEVRQGGFQQRGIAPGMQVKGLP